MSEDVEQYGAPRRVHLDKDTQRRIGLVAGALRHIDNLAGEDRIEAANKLNNSTSVLVPLVERAVQTWSSKPESRLADIALCLDDPMLDACRAELEAAGALDIVTCERRLDPSKAQADFSGALLDHEATRDQRRFDRASNLIEQAKDAASSRDRAELADKAVEELHRRDRETETPLAALWQEHVPIVKNPEPFSRTEAVMLDTSRRGLWARWFNRFLGFRGGLAPGTNVLIGAPPGGGKTSMGAALAVDAMAAGCPVTFWQLELGVAQTMEYLLAQDPAVRSKRAVEYGDAHHQASWRERAPEELPENYAELLTIPRWPSHYAEDIARAIQEMASKARRMRRAGKMKHKCNGVFVVDYAQMLRMKNPATRSQASHEMLTDAFSMIAKATAECGAVLVVLSQLTKASRSNPQKSSTGTEFSGGDFERAPWAAFILSKGRVSDTGEEIEAAAGAQSDYVEGKGQPRLIDVPKDRGVMRYGNNRHPAPRANLWFNNFAIYGDDADFPEEEQDLKGRANATKPKQGAMPF